MGSTNDSEQPAPRTMLVRLKAHNPRQGFVLQRYTVFGIRFEAGTGWSEVDADVADYLRTVREQDTLPTSPLAFDVCTHDEAKAMEEAERKAREVAAATAASPRITRREGTTAGLPMARGVETAPGAQPASQVGRVGMRSAVPSRVHGPDTE